MKISFVELAGFRGFRERTRFEFGNGFTVITGRNGVGKSTVLDAFDFVLTGSINKFNVTNAKGGGLSEHIWWIGSGAPVDHYVTVGFTDPDGNSLVVTRDRSKGLSMQAAELAERLCGASSRAGEWIETLVATTLLRDETIAELSLDLPEQARFTGIRAAVVGLPGPERPSRTTGLLKAAEEVVLVRRSALAQIQRDIELRLTHLSEAKGRAQHQGSLVEAKAVVADIVPEFDWNTSQPSELLGHHVAQLKSIAGRLNDISARAGAIRASLAVFATDEKRKESEGLATAIQNEERELVTAQGTLESARAVYARERALDEDIARLLDLVSLGEHLGLQDGRCPLCAATRSDEEYTAALAAIRDKVNARSGVAVTFAGAVKAAEALVEGKYANLAALRDALRVHTEEQSVLKVAEGRLRAELRELWAEGTVERPEAIASRAQDVHSQVVKLEQVVYMLDASVAQERVASIEGEIDGLRKRAEAENVRIIADELVVTRARQLKNAADQVPNEVMKEQFDSVLPLLKELYLRLRPHAEWRDIDADFGGKVRATLNLTVGEGLNPQFVFSSGQRRTAGLAYLLALLLARPWSRLNTILLDDPVQHIDDFRAVNIAETLSSIRRTGRQVIVTVEDSALADLLCRKLRSSPHERGYRYELGPDHSGSARIQDSREISPLPANTVVEISA